MSGFWHRLSHLLGWNTGRVVSFWHDSRLWIGFKCDGCGEINHATAANLKIISVTVDNPLRQLDS